VCVCVRACVRVCACVVGCVGCGGLRLTSNHNLPEEWG